MSYCSCCMKRIEFKNPDEIYGEEPEYCYIYEKQ